MGMPITVEVASASEPDAKAGIGQVFDWFHQVDQTYSTYKPESIISRINQGKLKLQQATGEVREVLAAGEHMRSRTGGYFDMRLPDGHIDPSGYVKGWSIGRAGRTLDRAGLENYCIEAGGDILVRGHNPDGRPWRVGIRHPKHHDQVVKVLELTWGAVATSGTYERGEHIYDPHSGRPAQGPASVTVVGSDIAWTDVAATAAFAMGASGTEWLAQQTGLECYVIGHNGSATFTPGLKKYFL
jgi:thiamine biosynthesis lipoprotein